MEAFSNKRSPASMSADKSFSVKALRVFLDCFMMSVQSASTGDTFSGYEGEETKGSLTISLSCSMD